MGNSYRYFDQFRHALNPQVIARKGRESRFQVREARKLGSGAWFWSFVLDAGNGGVRSIARTARTAGLLTAQTISRQAIHQRCGPEAVEFMRLLWQHLEAETAVLSKGPLPGTLSDFQDVHTFDSTTVGLLARLAERYPACRTNVRKAGLKIHTRTSLRTREAQAIRISPERMHDRKGIVLGSDRKDILHLMDLGFFDYDLFAEILDGGGDFVTRLKESANGTILNVRRGCPRRHIGERMNQPIYSGPVVDLDVEFLGSEHGMMLRVVGVFNRQTDEYHWYVCSLDPDRFSPRDVAEIYALRWQIELLYKNWKGRCHLTELASEKEEVALVLLYASLCFAMLGRLVSVLACRTHGLSRHEISMPIAISILAQYAVPLGQAIVGRSRRLLRGLLRSLLESLALFAEFPNRTSAVLQFANR